MKGSIISDSLLRREIGKIGVATIAMNGVIGSGIFALPAAAIVLTGYFSPWIFVLCGVLILSVALTLARAASFFEITGGPIVYTTHAFGKFVGFQTGLFIYVSRVAAIGASANLIVSHAAALWSPLESGVARAVAIAAYVSLATILNAVGVRAGLAAVYLLSVLKLLPLLLLILVGFPSIEWGTVAGAPLPAPGALGQTMLIMMYAFIGFEFSLVNAGETRNAKAEIPKTLVGTVLGIALGYTLIQLVAVSVAPDLGQTETPLLEVARRLMGPWGALLLGLGVVFSTSASSLTSLLTAPRVTFALARDGSLPAWFGNVNERSGAPVNSIVFCGILSAAIALSHGFLWLVTMSTLARMLTYALCIAAVPGIERTMPSHPGQFRLPGGLAIPAVALALSLWLISHSTVDSWLIVGALFIAGTIIFWFTGRTKRNLGNQSSSSVQP
ncbi:MAG TPA: APC family permease [Steroidobacteraceae bacterium]|nr:APC family permease [Steroidobacteraceae bacterium]